MLEFPCKATSREVQILLLDVEGPLQKPVVEVRRVVGELPGINGVLPGVLETRADLEGAA